VVLIEARAADARIGLDHEVGIIEIVRTPARHLVPAVGHLVSQPQAQVEIRPQLDVILEIPGAFRRAVAQRGRIPHHDRLGRPIL